MSFASRPWITAGVALAGAGLIGFTPVAAPLPGVFAAAVQLVTGATDITLDLVRHAESQDNADGILGTVPLGAHLTNPLGLDQASDVAPLIQAAFGDPDGIYASELVRTQETADPLATLLGMPVQILPGLNEINAGWLEGQPLNTFTEIGYIASPLMWVLGQYWVPQLGSTIDPNGMAFQDRVNDALQTIYDNSLATSGGTDTDVAFSHAGTIAIWTLMNVKNPDFSVVINDFLATGQPLPNVGQVVIEGNPTDGWTLVSWNGTPVDADPDLFTALFVDFRDLITAPQMALWHLWEAILGGDPTTIWDAFETGLNDVGTALLQFPEAVFNDIVAAFGDVGSTAAVAAGDAGALAADALAAI